MRNNFEKPVRIKKKAVRELIFWIWMIAAGGVFAFIWLAATGNGDQIYTDVVYEKVSAYQSNKSPERMLLYVLIFAGIILYAIYALYSAVCDNKDTACSFESMEEKNGRYLQRMRMIRE
ncbi:hypothetical protein C823_003018 [Eubacterium plexicaudatum ASF492]|nr:hypothetical protein C823_003018 [Eubacterium plexicaudatum ASF492]